MRKPEQAPEPSIEEILASIRRIIADDTPPAVTTAEEESPSRLRARPGVPHLRTADSAVRRSEGRSEDDVFELTEDFMLAEEAPAVVLQEPDEPAEPSPNGSYGDAFARRTGSDPYDDSSTRARSEDSHPSPAESSAAEAAHNSPSNGLASVMAEVQRFVTGNKSPEAPKPAAKSQENWAQPSSDPFKSEPASRPASRWSARQPAETSKGPEPLPTARSAPAAPATPRRSAFGMRDSWSQGVQMPVPDEGPAIPFASDESAELPAAPHGPAETGASLVPPADARDTAQTTLEDEATAVAADASKPIPSDVHMRAEKLADRVVSDFANNRFAAPPVAAFLKADKPLMDEITGSLASALAKVGDTVTELEDAVSPPEDIAEEMTASDLPNPTPFDEPAAPELPPVAEMPGLGSGSFVARPVSPSHAPEVGAVMSSDLDTPELPREEPDDIAAAPHPEPREKSSPYWPTGIAGSMSMPQVPAARGQMMPRPATTIGTARGSEFDRLPSTSSTPKTLEETVREMLRPLLVQWLNENMPRIINDAIREEMASVGLLRQRSDNERR
jgi:cell pole-organizing protein PopZ